MTAAEQIKALRAEVAELRAALEQAERDKQLMMDELDKAFDHKNWKIEEVA